VAVAELGSLGGSAQHLATKQQINKKGTEHETYHHIITNRRVIIVCRL
jgi:hypothetical protein